MPTAKSGARAAAKRKPSAAAAFDSARRARIWQTLSRLYPDTTAPLDHGDPFQLLVAVMLSAQTTDVAVNKATPELFAAYPDARAMAAAPVAAIEKHISTIGLYRNKAKFCKQLSQQLLDQFGGQVPASFDALTTLAGVGRKTAQVVLYHAFEQPGLPVDTHVFRLANKIGLTQATTPEATEAQLKAMFDPQDWGAVSLRLIWHGRKVCNARKSDCDHCAIASDCDFGRARLVPPTAAKPRAKTPATRTRRG